MNREHHFARSGLYRNSGDCQIQTITAGFDNPAGAVKEPSPCFDVLCKNLDLQVGIIKPMMKLKDKTYVPIPQSTKGDFIQFIDIMVVKSHSASRWWLKGAHDIE